MNKLIKILTVFFILFGAINNICAEDKKIVTQYSDSVQPPVVTMDSDTIVTKARLKPDPMRSVWMGAIVPGYGQLLNKKYWKLPIVYGGFLACSYFITWNSIRYGEYKTAYKDIADSDPKTNSYLDVLPKGYTIESYGGLDAYKGALKTAMEQTRYNRDLSVIVSVGFYLLTLVDAYVDAQLYDFDISPDLSLRVSPTILQNSYGANNTFGLQLSLKIK